MNHIYTHSTRNLTVVVYLSCSLGSDKRTGEASAWPGWAPYGAATRAIPVLYREKLRERALKWGSVMDPVGRWVDANNVTAH